jgi:hypothetical protein
VHDAGRRRRRPAEIGDEAGLGDAVAIAQATVGDDAGTAARREAPAIDIAGRGGARVAARVDNQHVAGQPSIACCWIGPAAGLRSLSSRPGMKRIV